MSSSTIFIHAIVLVLEEMKYLTFTCTVCICYGEYMFIQAVLATVYIARSHGATPTSGHLLWSAYRALQSDCKLSLPDKAECLPELGFADGKAALSDCREAD